MKTESWSGDAVPHPSHCRIFAPNWSGSILVVLVTRSVQLSIDPSEQCSEDMKNLVIHKSTIQRGINKSSFAIETTSLPVFRVAKYFPYMLFCRVLQ